MWNSVPSLQAWQTAVSWLAAGLILLSFLPAAASIIIGNRIETLKTAVAADRSLSDEQRNKLIEALRGHPMTIEFTWIAGDPEAEAYAKQIMDALDLTKSVSGSATPAIFAGAVLGLRMSTTDSPEARVLEAALRYAGIPFTFSGATPELRMSVGTKPRQ